MPFLYLLLQDSPASFPHSFTSLRTKSRCQPPCSRTWGQGQGHSPNSCLGSTMSAYWFLWLNQHPAGYWTPSLPLEGLLTSLLFSWILVPGLRMGETSSSCLHGEREGWRNTLAFPTRLTTPYSLEMHLFQWTHKSSSILLGWWRWDGRIGSLIFE